MPCVSPMLQRESAPRGFTSPLTELLRYCSHCSPCFRFRETTTAIITESTSQLEMWLCASGIRNQKHAFIFGGRRGFPHLNPLSQVTLCPSALMDTWIHLFCLRVWESVVKEFSTFLTGVVSLKPCWKLLPTSIEKKNQRINTWYRYPVSHISQFLSVLSSVRCIFMLHLTLYASCLVRSLHHLVFSYSWRYTYQEEPFNLRSASCIKQCTFPPVKPHFTAWHLYARSGERFEQAEYFPYWPTWPITWTRREIQQMAP